MTHMYFSARAAYRTAISDAQILVCTCDSEQMNEWMNEWDAPFLQVYSDVMRLWLCFVQCSGSHQGRRHGCTGVDMPTQLLTEVLLRLTQIQWVFLWGWGVGGQVWSLTPLRSRPPLGARLVVHPQFRPDDAPGWQGFIIIIIIIIIIRPY